MTDEGSKVLASNRRASHDYVFVEKFEAGLALTGPEVKSIRDARVSLAEAYAQVENGQVWLHSLHVQPYAHARSDAYDPVRPRRVLLHRSEIDRLIGQTARKGFTIIPTRLYLRRGWVKVELALARGKQAEDKRETLRRKADARETARAIAARKGRT